jgi:hypothetical protein
MGNPSSLIFLGIMLFEGKSLQDFQEKEWEAE